MGRGDQGQVAKYIAASKAVAVGRAVSLRKGYGVSGSG